MSDVKMTEVKVPDAKVSEDGQLELSNAGRGVWLVKVPKYLMGVWQAAPSSLEVGRLRITRKAGQGAKGTHVALTLSEAACALAPPGQPLPRMHRLDVSTVTRQTLGVFSHQPNSAPDAAATEAEKLFMEGRIVQKLECRPYADNCYMKLKQESIRKASVPQRQVQQYDKVVQNFKPVSDHKHNVRLSIVTSRTTCFMSYVATIIISFRLHIKKRRRLKVKKPEMTKKRFSICCLQLLKSISIIILRTYKRYYFFIQLQANYSF